MLNQLLKLTLFSTLLLWLKPRWRGLLALAAAVILIHVVHGEYLGYVELSEDSSFLIWSYLLKWVLLLVVVSVYLLRVMSGRGEGATSSAPLTGKQSPSGQSAPATSEDDGFDFLRDKKQLETRAEKVLSKPRD